MSESDKIVGTTLPGGYHIERVLGRGGMGTVYGATSQSIGRAVAVKMLQPALTREWTHVERFHREAELSASLGHPNIVSVTDFHHSDKGLTFYVMELLEGEHLYRTMKREGRLPPERACGILIQILSALGAAHDAGVVHRDLKPPNVFLVPLAGGVELVKLLDFGIAKLRESDGYQRLTATGAIVGTPHFIAPEQAKGRPVDGRTDLFAAGVLLHYMLAGQLPFDKPEMGDLVMQICSEDPPSLSTLLPRCDPALAQIALEAMAKDPADRFQSAQEMQKALAPFAPSRPSWPTVHEQSTQMLPASPGAQRPGPSKAPARSSLADQSRRLTAAVVAAPTWAKATLALGVAAAGIVLVALAAGVTWFVMDDGPPPGAPSGLPTATDPPPAAATTAPPAALDRGAASDASLAPMVPSVHRHEDDLRPGSARGAGDEPNQVPMVHRHEDDLGPGSASGAGGDPSQVPIGLVQQAEGARDPGGPPIGLVRRADRQRRSKRRRRRRQHEAIDPWQDPRQGPRQGPRQDPRVVLAPGVTSAGAPPPPAGAPLPVAAPSPVRAPLPVAAPLPVGVSRPVGQQPPAPGGRLSLPACDSYVQAACACSNEATRERACPDARSAARRYRAVVASFPDKREQYQRGCRNLQQRLVATCLP